MRSYISIWSFFFGGLFGVAQAFGGVELLSLKFHYQSACLKSKEVCCKFVLVLVCFYPCLRCLLKCMHSVCSKGAEIARSEFEGEF